MKARYLIDKEHAFCEMFQNDRTQSNLIAETEAGVLGKFVTLLSATLRGMKEGETLVIECEKQQI